MRVRGRARMSARGQTRNSNRPSPTSASPLKADIQPAGLRCPFSARGRLMHRGNAHRCSKTSRRAANVRLITVASISMCHAWLVWPSKMESPHDRSSHQHPAQDRLDAGSRAFDFDRGDFVELCLQRQGAADVHGRCSPPLQFRNPEYCEDHRLHAEEQGERQPGMPRGDRRGRSQVDQDKTASGCTCRAKAGRRVACRTARSTQNETGSGCACRAKASCRSTCRTARSDRDEARSGRACRTEAEHGNARRTTRSDRDEARSGCAFRAKAGHRNAG